MSTTTQSGPSSAPASATYLKAKSLLDSGRHDEALRIVRNQGLSDPWLRNLLGVCLLRTNQPAEAVELYRPVVWGPNGLVLRPDIPVEFKTNYATGLLLQGHVLAAVTVLDAIDDANHPAVQKLRGAVARWKNSLSFFGRWKHRLGVDPTGAIPLDAPLGDLP